MLILGVDVETTGLDAEKDEITEIGAVLWDTEARAPVQMLNCLIDIKGNVPEEITKLTGITDEMLWTYGIPLDSSADLLCELALKADYYCAHNAPFDRKFISAATKNFPGFLELVWIDTSVDVPYPEHITTRKLTHLAAEHGFVNPFPHRAVTDVLTMLQILSHYDINKVVESAKTPNITIRAKTNYNEREKAKECGYRWNPENKVWLKSIKINMLESETEKARNMGFEIGEWNV